MDSLRKINSKEFQAFELSSGEKSPNQSINLNSAKMPSQEKYLGLFRSKTDIKSPIQLKNMGGKRPNRKESYFILK
jgi:hypothetical protein